MNSVQETINDVAKGLHRAALIDQKTLRHLVKEDLPELVEYTAEEIQNLRKRQKVSQSVFAHHLNISPSMIRSLEQGHRHAHGAILKLLNIIDRHGMSALYL